MKASASRGWFNRLDRTVLVTGVALFAILVTSGLWAIELGESERRAGLQARAVAETSTIRAELENRLFSTLHLARGIRGFVIANPDLGEPDRLDVMLEAIRTQGAHVRNIGLGPDNVVTVVHPSEGNEAAIGLRYEDVPEQYEAVRQAMESRSTVVDGPVDLVQGGRGLISRTPVFLPDGSYWGLVSMVIDIDALLSDVARSQAYSPVDWALRVRGHSGEQSGVVLGDQAIFDDPLAVQRVQLPGSSWDLASVAGPQLADDTLSPALQRLLVLVGAALLTGLGVAVAEERRVIKRMSVRDPLTSLPNRRLLDDRLAQAIHRADRTGEHLSVLFVDLDGFKQVNDAHGHEAGDHVLLTVGERLRNLTRNSDTIARIGGDEFVALLCGHSASSDAVAVAHKLRDAVVEPIEFNGEQLRVGASVGVAHHPEHGQTPDGLLRAADEAMYDVKKSGKGDVALATRPADAERTIDLSRDPSSAVR